MDDEIGVFNQRLPLLPLFGMSIQTVLSSVCIIMQYLRWPAFKYETAFSECNVGLLSWHIVISFERAAIKSIASAITETRDRQRER